MKKFFQKWFFKKRFVSSSNCLVIIRFKKLFFFLKKKGFWWFQRQKSTLKRFKVESGKFHHVFVGVWSLSNTWGMPAAELKCVAQTARCCFSVSLSFKAHFMSSDTHYIYLMVEANPQVSVLLFEFPLKRSSCNPGISSFVGFFLSSCERTRSQFYTQLPSFYLLYVPQCTKSCYIIPLTHKEALPVMPAAPLSPQTRNWWRKQHAAFLSVKFSQLMRAAIFVFIQLISYLVHSLLFIS